MRIRIFLLNGKILFIDLFLNNLVIMFNTVLEGLQIFLSALCIETSVIPLLVDGLSWPWSTSKYLKRGNWGSRFATPHYSFQVSNLTFNTLDRIHKIVNKGSLTKKESTKSPTISAKIKNHWSRLKRHNLQIWISAKTTIKNKSHFK